MSGHLSALTVLRPARGETGQGAQPAVLGDLGRRACWGFWEQAGSPWRAGGPLCLDGRRT
eukprot:2901179-Alexandrium_andersonii.AAC.1